MQLIQNLAIIDRLTKAELTAIAADFEAAKLDPTRVVTGFSPEYLFNKDNKSASHFGFNLRKIIERNDYCAIKIDETNELTSGAQSIQNRFSKLRCAWNINHSPRYGCTPFLLQGYYAPIHNDRTIEASHQVMLIIENHGHRIYSAPSKSCIVPKAGDIMVLCTHQEHALFPNASKTAADCFANPLKFYAVPFLTA